MQTKTLNHLYCIKLKVQNRHRDQSNNSLSRNIECAHFSWSNQVMYTVKKKLLKQLFVWGERVG